jgi:hypothetical protein
LSITQVMRFVGWEGSKREGFFEANMVPLRLTCRIEDAEDRIEMIELERSPALSEEWYMTWLSMSSTHSSSPLSFRL